MRDVLTDLESWWRAGETVGVGTVVGTWLSSPRQPGAAMLVGPDGTAVGSVSGGCVEGAVYELASGVRDDGRGMLEQGRTGLVHYGHDGERRRDEVTVFVASFAPRPRMIVFGAID